MKARCSPPVAGGLLLFFAGVAHATPPEDALVVDVRALKSGVGVDVALSTPWLVGLVDSATATVRSFTESGTGPTSVAASDLGVAIEITNLEGTSDWVSLEGITASWVSVEVETAVYVSRECRIGDDTGDSETIREASALVFLHRLDDGTWEEVSGTRFRDATELREAHLVVVDGVATTRDDFRGYGEASVDNGARENAIVLLPDFSPSADELAQYNDDVDGEDDQ